MQGSDCTCQLHRVHTLELFGSYFTLAALLGKGDVWGQVGCLGMEILYCWLPCGHLLDPPVELPLRLVVLALDRVDEISWKNCAHLQLDIHFVYLRFRI